MKNIKKFIASILLFTSLGISVNAATSYPLSLARNKDKIKAGDTFTVDIKLKNTDSLTNTLGFVFTQEIDSNLELVKYDLTETSGTTDFESNVEYKNNDNSLLPRVVIEYGNPGKTLPVNTNGNVIATATFRVKDTFTADSVTIKYGVGTYKNTGETYSSYLTKYTCTGSDISTCTFDNKQLTGATLTISRALDYKPGSWSGEENVIAGPTDLAKYRKYLAGDSDVVTMYNTLDQDVKTALDLSGNGSLDLPDLIQLRLQLAGASTNEEICSHGPNYSYGTAGTPGYINCGPLNSSKNQYTCNYIVNINSTYTTQSTTCQA